MALIDWIEKFSVNVDEIDEQHKKWIGIINELDDALTKGKGRTVLGKIFQEMVEYINFHFSEEEKLLREIDYAHYNEHKLIHDRFKQKIAKLEMDFESGELILGTQVMSILKNWLEDHILIEDKKYSTCL